MKLLFLGIFIIGRAVAQIPVKGECPAIKNTKNFDISKIFGKWYHVEYYFPGYNVTFKCLTNTWSGGRNDIYSYSSSAVATSTGKSVNGTGTAVNEPNTNYLVLMIPQEIGAATPYYTFTDGTSYLAQWTCLQAGPHSVRSAWLYTRKANPSNDTLEKAYKVLEKNGISRGIFNKVNHDNCPKGY